MNCVNKDDQFFPGFLTLPTAYVTGNPVECVLHPSLWNKSHVWDPLGVGQVYTDQYEEDNVGHPITTVSLYFTILFEDIELTFPPTSAN